MEQSDACPDSLGLARGHGQLIHSLDTRHELENLPTEIVSPQRLGYKVSDPFAKVSQQPLNAVRRLRPRLTNRIANTGDER